MTTLTTPYDQRIDLAAATDAELLDEYGFNKAMRRMRGIAAARGIDVNSRNDSYQREIELQIWMRCYAPAFAAAMKHRAIFSIDDAENAAIAAMAQIVDGAHLMDIAESCENGAKLGDIAANLATQKLALDEVHDGLTMSNAGGNRHADTQAMTEEEKKADLARRRVLHADPQEYSFETAHTISGGGLHYEIDVDDALDQAAFGATTPVAALTQVISARTGQTEDEVRTWLHTFGITPEVDAHITALAQTDHNRAARIANGNRFPQADIAAIEGVSIATVERRLAKVRDAVWTDSELVGVLRTGLWSQKSIDAFTGTVREILDKEEIENLIAGKREAAARAAASETEEAAVWGGLHDDTFIADCIRENMVSFVNSGVQTSPLHYEVNEMTISAAIVSALTTHAGATGFTLDRAAVENIPEQFFIDYIADYLFTGSADVDLALVATVRAQVAEAVAA
ncbi:hypothetical protein [Microbacterium sp. Leaf203]|uniref:hypothetical protein n=1 Tax=Microbacterium sp. Leaf203 TaxID=1735677 RepID=UPI0006FBA4B4|nr:hypothetical protein [Microbacterium sp. Leaf203]KQM36834.1 hypothetical protein ASE56_10490 [Microbacterium sp. Leaf203]